MDEIAQQCLSLGLKSYRRTDSLSLLDRFMLGHVMLSARTSSPDLFSGLP